MGDYPGMSWSVKKFYVALFTSLPKISQLGSLFGVFWGRGSWEMFMIFFTSPNG